MIVYKEIEQRTEEWFRLRYGKIGGSDSAKLFSTPAKVKELEIEIASYQLEDFKMEEGGFVNAAMQRGIDLEPFAIMEMSRYSGVRFLPVGWIQSESHTLYGISPDGLSECGTVACETKCLGSKAHTALLAGGTIDKDYIFQAVHYFTVIEGLKTLYFGSFRPESFKRLHPLKITPDTLFNIGTDAKPVVLNVSDIVFESKKRHDALEANVTALVTKIKGDF